MKTPLISLLIAATVIASADLPNAEELEWRIVNDTVMGGRSQSSVTDIDDGLLRFSGLISLENQGGFASTRADNEK